MKTYKKQNKIIKENNKTKKLYKHFNFKKLRCSPKEKNKFNKFSCYTDDSLYKLKDLWNLKNPTKMINTNNTKHIHELLTKYNYNCKTESCWLNQSFTKNNKNKLKESFAPLSPKKWKKHPNEWLSSIDIISVMNQYEKAYKCFEFIGPSPIDFDKKELFGDCVCNKLCNFNLENQIKKDKTKIGIIFNTDTHDKDGSHWISMFINIKKQQIFFFDSVGDKVTSEIMVLVNKIKNQGKMLNPKLNFKFESNKNKEHQFGNTECGIYSLFFIIHMLQDKTNKNFYKTHTLKDKDVQHYRKIYFNEEL
jgi:hypothetical protein